MTATLLSSLPMGSLLNALIQKETDSSDRVITPSPKRIRAGDILKSDGRTGGHRSALRIAGDVFERSAAGGGDRERRGRRTRGGRRLRTQARHDSAGSRRLSAQGSQRQGPLYRQSEIAAIASALVLSRR